MMATTDLIHKDLITTENDRTEKAALNQESGIPSQGVY